MKRKLCLIFGLLTLLTLVSCGDSGSGGEIYGDDIGGDWHVWGLYDFETLNGETVAVGKLYDADGNRVGYTLYGDGESSPGREICELKCTDGGYTSDDVSEDYSVVVGDYSGDGLDDVGLRLKNGDILWYVQSLDEYDQSHYTFTDVEKSADNN